MSIITEFGWVRFEIFFYNDDKKCNNNSTVN